MKATKIALGILGGIAAGALAGILFAPAKGTDTRDKLLQKGTNYADDLKDKFGNFSKSLKKSQIYNNGKDLMAEGKSKLNDTKNKIQDASI